MTRQLTVKILPDGSIQAETHGIKGKSCVKYMHLLEEMLEAETVSSAYTQEYYEEAAVQEGSQQQEGEQQALKGGA